MGALIELFRPLAQGGDAATATMTGSCEWRPHAVAPCRWGFYELSRAAVYSALQDVLPNKPLAATTPYSLEGDAVFRQYLRRLALYIDARDAGHATPYPALVLGDVYAASKTAARADDEFTSTTCDLLDDIEKLLVHIEDQLALRAVLPPEASTVLRDAREQAIVVRGSCLAAMALCADLRFSHIADPRPVDAPVYEYTATVEGFSVIHGVRYDLDSDGLIVWLSSGYVYHVRVDAARRVDGVSFDARLVSVELADHRGAVRLAYENGVVSDWTAFRILALCEPKYWRFDDRNQAYVSLTEARDPGCRRLTPT